MHHVLFVFRFIRSRNFHPEWHLRLGQKSQAHLDKVSILHAETLAIVFPYC